MNTTGRRAFIKTGITAGTGLSLVSIVPGKTIAGIKTLRKEVDIFGARCRVNLELAEEVSDDTELVVDVAQLPKQKALAHVSIKPNQRLVINRFAVTLSVPLQDIARIWYTQQIDGLGQHAYISLPWGARIPAGGHDGSLLTEIQNRFGRNRGLMAFKDQTGDGSLRFAVDYGGKDFHMTINRFAEDRSFTVDAFNETVYIDLEDIHWNKAVSNFVEWYDRELGLTYDTPEFCYSPAFNSWYPLKGNQNQDDILRFARKCRELGITTFEIDSGWFINTGDWELNTKKIPDMKSLVRDIRIMGLKVIIWYRPFDWGRSKEYEKYRVVENGKPSGNLCVRCREVRERAGSIAGELMEKYDLDGLKIDFLDASTVKMINCEADHEHSLDFVADGSREAMRIMAESIRKVKPDAIIEYRLNYSNIANRQFASIYRGQDAPSDPDHIRRHLTLLRSWCIGVAPHADYAYWTPEVSNEDVSRFMAILSLYGVPTLSVDFDGLPKDHFAITKAWLDFYNENIDRLIHGDFDPLSNDFHYSVARVSSPGYSFIPAFLKHWPSVISVNPQDSENIYLYNGTANPLILTRIEGARGTYRLTTMNIFLKSSGKAVTVKEENGSLSLDHPVDIGGIVVLKRS
ncbi:alpha-galactosidase [Candidatus Latescibacterota bacterium]